MKILKPIFILLCMLPTMLFAQAYTLDLNKQWQFRKKGDSKWYPAAVPGTVHTDLMANQLIQDPFLADNEQKVAWVESEDWEYQTTFKLLKGPAAFPHLELQFDGLDTYAKVFLNDSLVLQADNMFRIWKVDVKKYVHEGDNKLLIVFESSVKRGRAEASKLTYVLPGDEKVFTRKAQYQYGWDWGPRLVTAGIWKGIKLNAWKDMQVLNVQYIQHSLTEELAEIEVICEVKSDLNATCKLWLSQLPGKIVGKDDRLESTSTVSIKKGISHVSVRHKIFKPEKWWCNGYGNPKMYDFEIMLTEANASSPEKTKIYDNKQLSIGLRTIELVQEKDSVGSSFYFKINGVPVFMKGANYIPSDNFLPRLTAVDYEKVVSTAVETNMNMLRVWGGGVYADDEFYKQCDKKGILVWQDMMFACAMYPGDAHFMENVAAEVNDQSLRLRNHPSLALWCGNNEMDEGWKNWGWQKQYKYSASDSAKIETDYLVLFDNLIKDILKVNDPKTFYWPSSPKIGWGHKESLKEGDSHYWGVWWGMEPFENYEAKIGRFVSEYGFQGMPAGSTFGKIGALKLKLNAAGKKGSPRMLASVDSVIFKAHQKHPAGYQTIRSYMERDYKIPEKFADYVYVSQLLQARGMKIAIEAQRRAKPYCMGTLYWQLNDCWPVTSWSTIDYYNNWKASMYQVKRSYEPLIVSVKEETNTYQVYLINDALVSGGRRVWARLIDFKGKLLWEKMLDVNLESNQSAIVMNILKSELPSFDAKRSVLNVSLMIPKALELASANYYFVKPKEFVLDMPEIKIEVISKGEQQSIILSSEVLAKDVFMTIDGEFVNLSDNFFDLLPGQRKTIFLPKGKVVEDLKQKIRIKSLADL